MNSKVLTMSLGERRQYEERAFDELHKKYDTNSQPLYIIESKWVESWLKYVKDDKTTPPEMINNKFLDEMLVVNDNSLRLCKEKDYYTIGKELWEFFISIYGGGPTITINDPNEDRMHYSDEEEENHSVQNNESQGSFEKEINIKNEESKEDEYGDGLAGLRNNSLYCYLNACLQCLVPI